LGCFVGYCANYGLYMIILKFWFVIEMVRGYPWYFFNDSRTGQRLGSNLPAGSAKRQRSVPSRSAAVPHRGRVAHGLCWRTFPKADISAGVSSVAHSSVVSTSGWTSANGSSPTMRATLMPFLSCPVTMRRIFVVILAPIGLLFVFISFSPFCSLVTDYWSLVKSRAGHPAIPRVSPANHFPAE